MKAWYIFAALLLTGCDFGYGNDNDGCGTINGRDFIISRISLDSLGTSSMEPFVQVPLGKEQEGRTLSLIGVSEDASTFYIADGLYRSVPSRVYALTRGEDSLRLLLELPDITGIRYSPTYNRFIYWTDNHSRGVSIQRIDTDGTNNIPIGIYRARIGELLDDEENLMLHGEIIEDSTGIWQLNINSLSLTQLVDDVSLKFNYAITPDGSRIAYGRIYNASREFDPTIYVRSTSDTTLTTYKGGGHRGFRFSHDGKWITYLSAADQDNPDPYKIWFINLETSEQFSVGTPLRANFGGDFKYPFFAINDRNVLFGHRHESYYVPIDKNATQELYVDRIDNNRIRRSGNHSGDTYDMHTSTYQHEHNGSWLYRADDVSVRHSCH